ncbi:MAG: DUF2927 domain-containing protein [Tropicimonas sp.]
MLPGARFLGTALMLLAVAACSPPAPDDAPQRDTPAADPLPPMRSFGAPQVRPSLRSNAALAADFLDLTFMLENGRPLERLTRYKGDIAVSLRGATNPVLERDLDRLLARLRGEARLPIRRAETDETPQIVVEVMPRRTLQRAVPDAACFVVPRVAGWQDFLAARRSDRVDWTTLERRETATVFLPGDVSPQEARDCLHEEIAQAVGPLNDLYRLPDSVFNDDNFHTVLTGFDMLMLRVTYDGALTNGMTRDQVAAALPAVLDRLNPGGRRAGTAAASETPRAWVDEIEYALGPRGSERRRKAAAERAVGIATEEGWNDVRLGFSLYALGRLALMDDPELALQAFVAAARTYRALPDAQVQDAHVAMQLAAFALSAGQPEGAMALIDESLPAVRASENAALLSSLMMMRAAALELLGRDAEARREREQALGWARYGFGSDRIVREHAVEIASLAHRPADR